MIKKILERLKKHLFFESIKNLENIAVQNGLIFESINSKKEICSLQDAEFKVFSQFGEDGIIAYILYILDDNIKNKKFIEFGVENYQESNTRYLLMSKNWKGLIIDGNEENISYVKSSYYYWRHDLKAVSKFITVENIEELLSENLDEGENNIGLLSVDIDGNDFYIFKAIKNLKADILILEYNSIFGKEKLVTVPYENDFYRYNKSFTGAYYGASIQALISIAEDKGYSFIGTNSAGNNSFFVKSIHIDKFSHLSRDIHLAKFRQPTNHKDKEILTQNECLSEIRDMPVIDLKNNTETFIKCLY